MIFTCFHDMRTAAVIFKASGLPEGIPPFTVKVDEISMMDDPRGAADRLVAALEKHVRDGTAKREQAWDIVVFSMTDPIEAAKTNAGCWLGAFGKVVSKA